MFFPILLASRALLLLAYIHVVHADAVATPSTAPHLPTVVRAASCTMNTTHCHCAYSTPSPGQQCLRVVTDQTDRCYMTGCAGGLKCDCASETLCEKSEITAYTTTSDKSASEFDCTSEKKTIPRVVVARTYDVHALASQMFALIVNNDQKSESSTGEYKVTTVELHSGDVIGLIARRMGQSQYGVKLRFEDQNGATRMIDSAWRCSPDYFSTWLSSSFDADGNGWTAPNESTAIQGDGFDKDVPWMWLDDKETIFCRVVL